MKVGGTLRSHISSGNAVRTFARPVLRNDRDRRIDADPKMKTPWSVEDRVRNWEGAGSYCTKDNPGGTGEGYNHG